MLAQKHIGAIDILRGVAATAVCFYHFTQMPVGGAPYLPDNNWLKITGSYGDLGVAMFFVISGFVIPWSMYVSGYSWKRFANFMARRSIRIELPYMATIALLLLSQYAFSLYNGDRTFTIDWLYILLHIGYLVPFFHREWLNPIFWTLAIEFQYYLLMALVFPLLVHPERRVRYLLLAALILSAIVITDLKWVFSHLLLFLAGIFLFLYRSRKIGRTGCVAGSVLVLSLLAWQSGVPMVIAAIITLLVIGFAKKELKRTDWFGRISYSLYLVHGLAGGYLVYFTRNMVQGETARTLFVFAAVLFSMGAAWVFYLLVERPSVMLARKLK